MKSIHKKITVAVLSTCLWANAQAETFVVKNIQFEGLQRISKGTALTYLPIHAGDEFNTQDSAKIIRALYKTGFFSNVQLMRRGNTLVVKVSERATIGKIKMVGNKEITTENLKGVLNNVGIAEGRVFDQSTLESVKSSLQSQYYDRGNYNAVVTTTVVPQSENRVDIHIDISEGKTAKIKEIKIIGNHAFSSTVLRYQMKLSTNHLWSILTQDDQYSREKLDADLETLRSYYMDHGYVNFKINSAQVSITPDKKDVYILINVTEGEQYKIKGFKLAGDLIYSREDLTKLVQIKPGDIFSRKTVNAGSDAIGNYLGNDGYVFAKVKPIPEVDNKNREVTITYVIEPGQQVYVRRINFSGNTKTADYVLRREMRQQEAALASLKDIKSSEHRLNLLGYFKDVKVDTKRVPGVDDQVDINYNVVEAPSATLTMGAGYSDDDGLLINAGFNQPNFLGTGKSLGVNFDTSDYERSYSINYFNPYYTKDGIGRGITAFAERMDTDDLDINTYTTDTYGVNMNYNVPIRETDSIGFGYGYHITSLDLGNTPSAELSNFVNQNGDRFNNVVLNAGWSHMAYDRMIFPTKGFAQSLNVVVNLPGGGSDKVSYYKTNYLAHLYLPITHGFILSLRGEVGYGDGFGGTKDLPVYDNYYAGGIGTQGAVRGYDAYSIGPKDSNGDTLGGNMLVDGTIELIIPTPITPDSFRLTTFVDFGNVYSDAPSTTDSGPIRTSVGVAAHWRSPIGPLIFSFAKPLNKQKGDDTEPFQFTVGTSF